MEARLPVSTPRGRPALYLADQRDEKPDGPWYEARASENTMNVPTIKRGFGATNTEMDELWKSIEMEMDAREVLSRDSSKIKGRGGLQECQAKRLEAVDAGIKRVENFENMMSVINAHQDYKSQMRYFLRSHCLSRYNARRKPLGTPAQAKRRGRSRGVTASRGSVSTPTPTKEPVTAPTAINSTLGSQVIRIGVNGVEDKITYSPLHLISFKNPLKKRNFLSDEMKARVQPEDLSFDRLRELLVEDCAMVGEVSVTCPGLRSCITNERNFQMAIHDLLERRSELKFMCSDSETEL
ncbi:MAG: hypothetical protein Q9161_000569 [Pseudevernia consocians]